MTTKDEAHLQKLETLLESVRRGVDEAKAGHFSEADRIMKELRDEYEKEQLQRAINSKKSA